jgi:chromosome segregation ATPase
VEILKGATKDAYVETEDTLKRADVAELNVRKLKSHLEAAQLVIDSLKKELQQSRQDVEGAKKREGEAQKELTAIKAKEVIAVQQFGLADALVGDLISHKTRVEVLYQDPQGFG